MARQWGERHDEAGFSGIASQFARRDPKMRAAVEEAFGGESSVRLPGKETREPFDPAALATRLIKEYGLSPADADITIRGVLDDGRERHGGE